MRLHVGLRLTFWQDAINIVVYLINHGPLVLSECKLLEEVWSEKEVKLSHLKVLVVFLIFILISMLIANLMQNLESVSLLAMMMSCLVMVYRLTINGKSSRVGT